MRLFHYTKTELAKLAHQQNFIRDTLEKVIRLADVLNYINNNPIMRSRLVLKGGTAINLTVFPMPRLSVDIDLDYSSNETREEMLIHRAQITEELDLYMQTQGYLLSPQSKRRHSLDSFVFTYQNLGSMRDNIKVEINYSLRSHLFLPTERPILSDMIRTDSPILDLHPIELFAAKINALLSRAAARDLYDTYNMISFRLFPPEELALLRKSVVFYTAISQEEIPAYYNMNSLDQITLRKIRTDLLPVIQKGEFINLTQMKETVKEYLSQLMQLTPNEREFLTAFANKVYLPEQLFDDTRIVERIQNHPMALWKTMR